MPPETLSEALVECIKALGGSKVVGPALWPAKGVDAAQRHLLACVNSERPEKLGLDEVEHIMRMARERGCHVAMEYLAESLSCAAPVPVQPKDQADDLRRRFIESTKALQALAQQIESLDRTRHSRAA